jgi:mono/diheme cytochrome c family protein
MKKLILLLPIAVFFSTCTFDKGEVPVKDSNTCDSTISYAEDIAPLVTNYCISCHVSGGTGTGDFSDYAGLKIAVDNGSLMNRVVDLKDMPQAGSPTLSDAERKLVSCWIKQGAPDN